jgi:predicted membrane-bound spermidine synthase
LFALSGFSGLIYESIWTHYLKLFLGHAAYSQTLVLAIFMGGMAIGSWICSKYSSLWKNLLLGYALTEGIIGVCALIFHNAFVYTLELSYTSIIPQLGNPFIVSGFKWTLSALMILPQSVLLGMTFPLMSAGILRLFPDKPGRSVAMLYFTNSIGAAIGVLVSGFMLIRWTGLPGTIRIAGMINILLAFTVWLLIRKYKPEGEPVEVKQETAYRESNNGGYWFFLLVSLVTGTSSFIYEIGWIRMLSLVLGSSTHAFELMLSAFIFGLAFGGLWIQRRIDQVTSSVRYLAWVQLIMGLLALSTLLLYGNTFEVMQWIIKSLSKTDTGYALFNLSSSGIAWAIMLPTTFCAGMTLPLITFTLIKQGYGERSIGAVYAANTVGAIVAVFFAIHFGMPLLGLKGLITVGAGLDIGLGMTLFWDRRAEGWTFRQPAVATAIGICAIIGILLFVKLDPYKMASGVYRYGTFSTPENHRLLYYRDGKTATVSCFLTNSGMLSIRTNGKPDAAMMIIPGMEPAIDEYTMILLGVIPMTLQPNAKTAASIGLGSGMTSHILLCNPLLRQLDTVEIEKGMVEAANNFRPRVELVYTDPRSKIYIDDAKTFFSTYNKQYDLIVSEPSNPWVSGVAGLFSEEFYRLITHHLNDDGLFVQWLQLYDIDVDLVVSVLKAISTNFSDFAIYAANRADVMIIAKKNGLLSEPDYSVLKIPRIAALLKRIHVERGQDIAIRKIGTKKFLKEFLESFPIRTNSDYCPVLDQNAASSRFIGSSAQALLNFAYIPVPTFEMLDGSPLQRGVTSVTPTREFDKAQETITAVELRDYFLSGDFNTRNVREDLRQKAVLLRRACKAPSSLNESERLGIAFNLSVAMISYLTPTELEPFWKLLESGACGTLPPSSQERQWYNLFKAVGKRDGVHMLEEARTLLASKADMTPLARRYLLASGMLGALVKGDRKESSRLWSEYKNITFGNDEPDLLFRLLLAESLERQNRAH